MPKTIKVTLGPARPAFEQSGKADSEDLSAIMGEASMAAARYGNGAGNRAGRCISDLENHIARLNRLVQNIGYELGEVLESPDSIVHECLFDNVSALQADLLKRAGGITRDFIALCESRD